MPELRDLELLDLAGQVFRDHIQPFAQEIDSSPFALGGALGHLGRNGLLCLRRPEKFGGPAMSETGFRQFQELSARYSGALSFLMTQHQSAVSLLAKSENEPLQAAMLPQMGETGNALVGIGISQLRRPGPPMVRAEAVPGGYRVDGTVPWITGLGFFHEFIVGAQLDDGSAVLGLVPLPFEDEGPNERLKWAAMDVEQSVQLEDSDAVATFSRPMRLAAFQSANTVTATLESWFLSDSDVLFVKPPGWAQRNDMINIVLQGHFAIGCAQAGLDQLESARARRPHPSLEQAHRRLFEELAECRAAAAAIPAEVDGDTTDEKLGIRAWAIELAVRCAHAGVVAWGGAANSMDHPAQRVYREALVYSVSAQTPDVMAATLERLAARTR